MKKLFKSMNDSQYHFSLRKMSVGVCSVVLGLFFVGVNNTQTVKADVIQNTATQVQPKVQQKVTDSTNSNSTVTTNGAEVTPVKETSKVEENNLNVSANNKETETVNSNSTVKSHEETLPKITEGQSKDNTNVEKTSSELVKQSENNAQKQTQSVETNTLDLNNSNFKSNDNVATSLLASRAMFYYVPFSGWENHNGKLYYRNWDGSYIRNQWAAPTGTTHYFGREGYTINNQWYRMPDNNTYYFDHTGHTVKNRWYRMPNSNTYYFDNAGHTVKNRWYRMPNSNTYYFDNAGHTVKNRWYRMPDSNTYYFDNTGHTVKNRWYSIPNTGTYYFDDEGHTVKNRYYILNGVRYWFDNTGHTQFADRYIHQNGLTIDTTNMRLSGRRNGNGYIFVLDPYGNEKSATWASGSFDFDASDYAGQTITLITRNGSSTTDREIAERQSIYIPKMNITNIKVNPQNTRVSGKLNGDGYISVLDPYGNEESATWASGSFDFDASDYAGQTITLITRNGSSTTDRETSVRQSIYIPKMNITNIKVNPQNTRVSGKLNGDGYIFVLDPYGNEESATWASGNFDFNASDYAGQTITLITRNGSSTTDREIAVRQSIYIPYLY